MKVTMRHLAVICSLLIAANCQNTGESANTGGNETPTLNSNTMTFKLDGNPVTISGITRVSTATETIIGKQADGNYLFIENPAPVSGTFDKNSTTFYILFHKKGGVDFRSDNGTANVTFNVTVTATEITGTFSGTLRDAGGTTLALTDGSFRVNK